MAIEARIPTILRSYTGGEKAVTGEGGTLQELFVDLDSRYEGLRGRLVSEDGSLNRFVNVYLNDEDVRFLGGAETPLTDGDVVTILPAVAGG
ncbi:MAG TPA: MoaD/ThiS family protein [Mycobacteriales bacterium]|nr:MoaD/ThiS family protein [Mycobacteriales bacterium]